MSEHSTKRGFASRPGDADSWIKASDTPPRSVNEAAAFTARLPLAVTPALRGRINVAAFRRGATVADMLRELLAREFPADAGELP